MDMNKELQEAIQAVDNMSTGEFKELCNKAGYFPEDFTKYENHSSLDIRSVARDIITAYNDQVEKCLENYLSVKLKVDVAKMKKLEENFNSVKLKGTEDYCFIRSGRNTSFYKGKDLIFSVTMGETGDLCVAELWKRGK